MDHRPWIPSEEAANQQHCWQDHRDRDTCLSPRTSAVHPRGDNGVHRHRFHTLHQRMCSRAHEVPVQASLQPVPGQNVGPGTGLVHHRVRHCQHPNEEAETPG